MIRRTLNSGKIYFKDAAGTVLTTKWATWAPLTSKYFGLAVEAAEIMNTTLFICHGFSQRRAATKLVKQGHYIYLDGTECYLITGLEDFGTHTELVGLRQSVPTAFQKSTAGGLISEWAFRSASALLTDERALNNLGNLGSVSWNSSIPSGLSTDLGSASFNGSSNLEIADGSQQQLDITGTMSVFLRVKINSLASTRGLFCKGDAGTQRGYYLYVSSAGKVNFELSNDGTATTAATGATSLTTGTWYSIAGVYDGSKIYVYVNGALDSNGSSNPTNYSLGIFNNTTKFSLGVRGDGAQFLNGYLAHVLVCSQAKTAAQVATWHSTDSLE